MKYLFVFIAIAIVGLYYLNNYAVAENNRADPVVVELYTSQSCSSCPSADRVLSEIANNDNIIALGCHVTYWNHLHWKDTLSLQDCTDRQRAFNRDAGTGRVYTPQMVINGADEFVGSRRGTAFNAIASAARILPLTLVESDRQITVTLPANIRNQPYVAEWVTFADHHDQHVPSGENRGRHLSYTNPIKAIDYSTNSGPTLSHAPVNGNIALIIRDRKAGKVIAAGQLKS